MSDETSVLRAEHTTNGGHIVYKMADYTLTVEHYTIPHNTLLELISFNLIGVLTSYDLGIIRGVVLQR